MILAFLSGLEKAPTFLVPIINPPFADNSPHLPPGGWRHRAGLISTRQNPEDRCKRIFRPPHVIAELKTEPRVVDISDPIIYYMASGFMEF